MNRVLLWITTAVLGASATLITSIGGLLGSVLFLLLATPLIVRGDHAVALSGLLMGFGAIWSLLLAQARGRGDADPPPRDLAQVGPCAPRSAQVPRRARS